MTATDFTWPPPPARAITTHEGTFLNVDDLLLVGRERGDPDVVKLRVCIGGAIAVLDPTNKRRLQMLPPLSEVSNVPKGFTERKA